jgi:hypothetical protein
MDIEKIDKMSGRSSYRNVLFAFYFGDSLDVTDFIRGRSAIGTAL